MSAVVVIKVVLVVVLLILLAFHIYGTIISLLEGKTSQRTFYMTQGDAEDMKEKNGDIKLVRLFSLFYNHQ